MSTPPQNNFKTSSTVLPSENKYTYRWNQRNPDSYNGASNGLFQRSTLGLYGTPHSPLIPKSCADDHYGIPHEARGAFFQGLSLGFPSQSQSTPSFGLCINYLWMVTFRERWFRGFFPSMVQEDRAGRRYTNHLGLDTRNFPHP
jgi:hypothetical protein